MEINRVLHVILKVNGQGQEGLCSALKTLGHEYKEFDWNHELHSLGVRRMRRKLFELSHSYRPDFTFMQIQTEGIIDGITAQHLHGFVMNWTGDVRSPVPGWYFDVGRSVNITCFSNMHDVEVLRQHGIATDFLQIGFDPLIFNPQQEKISSPEIVFMANHYRHFPLSGYRRELALFLRNHYGNRFQLFGQGWRFHTENLNSDQQREAQIYSNCKIAINCSHFDYSRYSYDRIFRIMGSGAFCLTKAYPDLEMDFKDGGHLSVFRDLNHLKELIDYYLVNDGKRNRIQEEGTKLVHEHHTWMARMKDIREILKKYSFVQN